MTFRFLDWTARPAHIAAQFQWEPSGLWVGVFWDFRRWSAEITGSDRKHGAYIGRPWTLHVYVCLVPRLPLHVYIERTVRPAVAVKSDSRGAQVVPRTDEKGAKTHG